MTATFSRLFPPAHGVAVGQLAPRVRRPRWHLRLMAGIIVVFVVLVVAVAALSFGDRAAGDTVFLLFEVIFLIFFAAVFGDTYLAARPTELIVRLRPDGIEGAAGKYSLVVPWNSVQRLWVVRSGSRCPVLCVAADDLSRFAPGGFGWRVKAYANRRLFGTPLATPLASTGLSEPGVLDAVRGYRKQSDRAAGPPSVALGDPTQDPQPSPAHRRFRNRLVAGLAVVAVVVAGATWLTAVTLLQVEAAPGEAAPPEARRALWVVAAFALAFAATLTVAQLAIRVYHAIVPLGDVAGRLREPVLRVGPDGVEHIVRGKRVRLPWAAVRRTYLAGDRSGPRAVCVTTAEPMSLVPQVRNWAAKARQNEQRYGAPVAVSLADSGLTGEDLLNAVRHFSGGQVTVG